MAGAKAPNVLGRKLTYLYPTHCLPLACQRGHAPQKPIALVGTTVLYENRDLDLRGHRRRKGGFAVEMMSIVIQQQSTYDVSLYSQSKNECVVKAAIFILIFNLCEPTMNGHAIATLSTS